MDKLEELRKLYDSYLEHLIDDFETTDEEFDTLIDDTYEEVRIGCSTFYPSQILKELDPVAYDMGHVEEDDNRRADLEDDDEIKAEALDEALDELGYEDASRDKIRKEFLKTV